jgi:hypothetical protein
MHEGRLVDGREVFEPRPRRQRKACVERYTALDEVEQRGELPPLERGNSFWCGVSER